MTETIQPVEREDIGVPTPLSLDTISIEVEEELDQERDKELKEIRAAIPKSEVILTQETAKDIGQELPAPTKAAVQLSANDLSYEPNLEDMNRFGTIEFQKEELGTFLKNGLATTTLNNFRDEVLDPFIALDPEGTAQVQGTLNLVLEGLQEIAFDAIKNPVENTAYVRKYLAQYFLGTNVPEAKVNELQRDLEDIIKSEIADDPFLANELDSIDFSDGVSQEEYDRFVRFGEAKFGKIVLNGFDKTAAKVWKEITRVFSFTPGEEGTEEEADQYTQFQYWGPLLAGTFLGNDSAFGFERREGFGVADVGINLALDFVNLFYSRSKEQEAVEKELDRVFGKKWKSMTMARVLREIAVMSATRKISQGVIDGFSRIVASKIPSLAGATSVGGLIGAGSRAVATASTLAMDGMVYGLVDVSADVAIAKVQGREITAKMEQQLQEKLVHMFVFANGLGLVGAAFSLGATKLRLGKLTPLTEAQTGREAFRKKLNAWVGTKSKDWLQMVLAKIGPAAIYNTAQKFPHLLPTGARKQQAHIKSLKGKVFGEKEKDATIRQLEQVAKKSGMQNIGEMAEGPEHLLNSPDLYQVTVANNTIVAAAQKLKKTRDFLPGDEAFTREALAKVEQEAFPEAGNLFNIARKSFNSMRERFKATSMSNLSPFASKALGEFRFFETTTRKAASDFHNRMLPVLRKTKRRTALEIALQAGSELERKLTPVELVGQFGLHPKDVARYFQIRGMFDEAHALYIDSLSRRFNQQGFKTVKGSLSDDGAELLARPYDAEKIFGEVGTANYSPTGVLETVGGKEFNRYIASLDAKAAQAEITKVAQGNVFVVETNVGTGQTVLRKGVRGSVVDAAELVPVSAPLAKIHGYFPGYREGNHIILQLDKGKLKQLAVEGGTEAGRKSSAVQATHRAGRYSIAKRKFDELERANNDINIEYLLIDTSSKSSSQVTLNKDFLDVLGEAPESVSLALLSDLRKRLSLGKEETEQLTQAVYRASFHPTLTDRVKGQAVQGLGKNKGAPEFNIDPQGNVVVGWNPKAVPYTNSSNAAHLYLNNLARELGERDIVAGTKRYFLENYGDLLSNPADVYSNILTSKLEGTNIEKAKQLFDLKGFQRVIGLHEFRGRSPFLDNAGHKMVEGAKVANDRLAETASPLHQLTAGILDSVVNNPNIPTAGVHLFRKFTSLRLFSGSLRIAAFQLLPALENVTFSMLGPRHILEPLGVAKDAVQYLAYTLAPGKLTNKMVKLPGVKRALDFEKAVNTTGVLADLRIATPGGADSITESVLGKNFHPIYKAGSEAGDWLLYGAFRASEGINRLIASSATYRRMEIFRDAALKAQKPFTPEQRQALSFWQRGEQGSFELTNSGMAAFGNETRLIAGDMAARANFPASNKGLLGLAFQYNGILIPRLLERYIPGYGRTFSPARQAWNAAQISTYLGVGGVAFGLEAVEAYHDVMNKIFKRPETGRVMVERHIEETAQFLGDLSATLEIDTTKEEWNKLLRDGVLGQHLSQYPGDIQKFLPSRMISEFVGNYTKEGYLPVNLLTAVPAFSQIEKQAIGVQRAYTVLEEFVKGLPENGLSEVIRNPETREEGLHYLGDAFKRFTRAASYSSGFSQFIVALEVFSDDWDGRTVPGSGGKPMGVPFPSDEPDEKFRNFISIWMGIFPGAREELRELGSVYSKSRFQWATDIGRQFNTMKFDLKDEEGAQKFLDDAWEQIKGKPDEAMLSLALINALVRTRLQFALPATTLDVIQMSKLLQGKILVPGDTKIIKGLITPVEEE